MRVSIADLGVLANGLEVAGLVLGVVAAEVAAAAVGVEDVELGLLTFPESSRLEKEKIMIEIKLVKAFSSWFVSVRLTVCLIARSFIWYDQTVR